MARPMVVLPEPGLADQARRPRRRRSCRSTSSTARKAGVAAALRVLDRDVDSSTIGSTLGSADARLDGAPDGSRRAVRPLRGRRDPTSSGASTASSSWPGSPARRRWSPTRGAARRRAAASVYGSLGPVEDLVGGAGLDDPAVLHHQDPVGHVGDDAHVVGDQHDARRRCGRLRSRISLRISACTVTSRAVVGSSAISSFGSQRQRLGDHRALPLTAGQLVRVGVDAPLRARGSRPA